MFQPFWLLLQPGGFRYLSVMDIIGFRAPQQTLCFKHCESFIIRYLDPAYGTFVYFDLRLGRSLTPRGLGKQGWHV